MVVSIYDVSISDLLAGGILGFIAAGLVYFIIHIARNINKGSKQ